LENVLKGKNSNFRVYESPSALHSSFNTLCGTFYGEKIITFQYLGSRSWKNTNAQFKGLVDVWKDVIKVELKYNNNWWDTKWLSVTLKAI
jgi:hypothetical protein